MNTSRWLQLAAVLLALTIIAGFSGCDLATKSYTIYVQFGHMNIDDAKPISMWVSGMGNAEGAVGLQQNNFFPADSYIEHTVSLSNPEDFKIYVESESGIYDSASWPIKDGAYYNFNYIQIGGEFHHIEGVESTY